MDFIFSKRSVLYAIFSCVLLWGTSSAMLSDSKASSEDFNQSTIKYAEDKEDCSSKPEDVPTKDPDEQDTGTDQQDVDDVNQEYELEQVEPPSFSHKMRQISASGKVIIIKVLKCDDANYEQNLLQIYNSRVLSSNSYTDSKAKNYFNRQLYKQASADITFSSGNADIIQSARQCSGSQITQGDKIILDCASWCEKPISVEQSVTQTSSSGFSQIMELYVVCPKGVKPKISLNRKKYQSSGVIRQNFKAFVLYRI